MSVRTDLDLHLVLVSGDAAKSILLTECSLQAKWWETQWSWWTVLRYKTSTYRFTVVVSTPLILYGCCWPIWRPFVSTTKQNQQHNRAQLYNALWVKHETPWCWNPALGSQPWLFQLSIIYYVSAHWKRMWSQVCSPKSPRSKLPHIGKLLFP